MEFYDLMPEKYFNFKVLYFITCSFLQLECPLVIATIFVSGIGGTFQYGYCISVMTSPSEVNRITKIYIKNLYKLIIFWKL